MTKLNLKSQKKGGKFMFYFFSRNNMDLCHQLTGVTDPIKFYDMVNRTVLIIITGESESFTGLNLFFNIPMR